MLETLEEEESTTPGCVEDTEELWIVSDPLDEDDESDEVSAPLPLTCEDEEDCTEEFPISCAAKCWVPCCVLKRTIHSANNVRLARAARPRACLWRRFMFIWVSYYCSRFLHLFLGMLQGVAALEPPSHLSSGSQNGSVTAVTELQTSLRFCSTTFLTYSNREPESSMRIFLQLHAIGRWGILGMRHF